MISAMLDGCGGAVRATDLTDRDHGSWGQARGWRSGIQV